MMPRVLRALALASIAAFLLSVGLAAAKMPYFSIEVSPPRPVADEVVVVDVRMWDDAQHTQAATWWPEQTMEGLVEFQGDVGRVPVDLVRREPGVYGAEVTLDAGTWRLVPFPRAGGGMPTGAYLDGYPSPVTLTVESRAGSEAIAFGAAGGLGIVTVGLLIRGRVRRRPRARRGGMAG